MPSASVGRLRFLVGTDDFFFPYAISAACFLPLGATWAWVFFHAYVDIARYEDLCAKTTVEEYTPLGTAVFVEGCVLTGLFFFVAAASAACAYVATRGTILQESKRVLAIPLAAASSLATVCLFIPIVLFLVSIHWYMQIPCVEQLFADLTEARVFQTNPIWRLTGMCIFSLVFVLGSIISNVVLLQSRRGFSDRVQRCCHAAGLCCGCSESLAETEGGGAPIGEDVTDIMARIFVPLPLVLSDILAGGILLAALQRRRRERELAARLPHEQMPPEQVVAATGSMLTPPSLPLRAEDVKRSLVSSTYSETGWLAVDDPTLKEAEHFLHWAEVAYGVDNSQAYQEMTEQLGQWPSSASTQTSQRDATEPANEEIFDRMHLLRKFARHPMKTGLDITYGPRKGRSHDAERGSSKAPADKRAARWRVIIVKRLGIRDEDILDMQLENKALGNVPYFVALDRRRQKVILSIRGSASVQDAFTDMITTAAPLATLFAVGGLFGKAVTADTSNVTNATAGKAAAAAEDGADEAEAAEAMADAAKASEDIAAAAPNLRAKAAPGWQQALAACGEAHNAGAREFDDKTYPGGYAHRGVLLSAVKLLECVRDTGVLAAAVKEHADWGVVITGHSLGAGLAALIGMALRVELGDRLSCWAFCPPGGLVSVEQAINMSGYVTSVLHAKDPVSRMTWRSLEKLRDELMVAIASSRVNKNALWWRRFAPLSDPDALSPAHLLHDDVPTDDSEVQRALQRYRKGVKNAQLLEGPNVHLQFWAPGQLIFLRRLKAEGDTETGPSTTEGDIENGVRPGGMSTPAAADGGGGGGGGGSGGSGRMYHAAWITFDRVEAEGLLTSNSAADDHNLVRVCSALRQSRVHVGNDQLAAAAAAAPAP
eukprot:jgi/Tetstr1/463379/TSEL_008301.t1